MRRVRGTGLIVVGLVLVLGDGRACLGNEGAGFATTRMGAARPALSDQERERIAHLSVPELTQMLREGDRPHASAALARLTANWRDNFDLLLSLAGERRGDMVVEGVSGRLWQQADSHNEEDRGRVDKFLDFLEAQLSEDKPPVHPEQAVRGIGRGLTWAPLVRDVKPGAPVRDLTTTRPAESELPYGYHRALDAVIRCLDHPDWRARREAVLWLADLGLHRDVSTAEDMVALLSAQVPVEEARLEDERIKAIMRTTLKDLLDHLRGQMQVKKAWWQGRGDMGLPPQPP